MLGVIISLYMNATEDSWRLRSCTSCYGARNPAPPAMRPVSPVSPELNRDYYIPPSRITWRKVSEEELKDEEGKISQSFIIRGKTKRECYIGVGVGVGDGGLSYSRVGEDSPPLPVRRRSSSATTTMSDGSDGQDLDHHTPPTTLCDRLRMSLSGVCTQSRWVWTYPLDEAHGLQPVRRSLGEGGRASSFVDDEQPGLQHRTQIVDTRKRIIAATRAPLVAPDPKKQRTGSLYPYKSSASGEKMVSIQTKERTKSSKSSSSSTSRH